VPQFSAASTAARISAGVYRLTSSGSYSEATPPPAMTLICDAPSASCSRVRVSTAGTPSASAVALTRSANE
jgi:hypothetical protein